MRILEPIVTVREQEGITVVVDGGNLNILLRVTWITLQVHSDLAAVGLTAAFAIALIEAGISCNVVAGAFHDHIFVPVGSGDAAMAALLALQQRAAKGEALTPTAAE